MEKTNALRLLDASNIKYVVHEYDNNLTNGQEIAKVVNRSEDEVFKTLVTVSNPDIRRHPPSLSHSVPTASKPTPGTT